MALKDGFVGWDHKPSRSSYRSAQELLNEERPAMPWDMFIPKLPVLQLVGVSRKNQWQWWYADIRWKCPERVPHLVIDAGSHTYQATCN